MEIRDILFINFDICERKSVTNNTLFILIREAVIKYYEYVKELNKNDNMNQKEKALRKINNHLFNLMYEALVNVRYELFNSCFRLCRSMLEDRVLIQFIAQASQQQAYWFNRWHYVKIMNNTDEYDINIMFKTQEEINYATYLTNSFVATHERIFGSDYGYAQETLGNKYITMKDIMHYVDNSDQTYAYYKLFSDLSHGSNDRTNRFDYLLRNNPEFNEHGETAIYVLWCYILKKVAYSTDKVDQNDSKVIVHPKEKINTLEDYIQTNNIVKEERFKEFLKTVEIPEI